MLIATKASTTKIIKPTVMPSAESTGDHNDDLVRTVARTLNPTSITPEGVMGGRPEAVLASCVNEFMIAFAIAEAFDNRKKKKPVNIK